VRGGGYIVNGPKKKRHDNGNTIPWAFQKGLQQVIIVTLSHPHLASLDTHILDHPSSEWTDVEDDEIDDDEEELYTPCCPRISSMGNC
jgi:hypothetical protein